MSENRPHISIREATDGDAAAFAEFFWNAWREAGPDAPGFTGATEAVIAELTKPEAVRRRIGGPEHRMYLAWDDAAVVGFAATRRMGADDIELAGIIVLRSSAGRGVGTALVGEALAHAKEQGLRTMVVRTETTNDAARGFYESCGFAVSATAMEQVDDLVVEVWELRRDLAT